MAATKRLPAGAVRRPSKRPKKVKVTAPTQERIDRAIGKAH